MHLYKEGIRIWEVDKLSRYVVFIGTFFIFDDVFRNCAEAKMRMHGSVSCF